MINLGKVKFVNYEIKLDVNIFQDRAALLRYFLFFINFLEN
jgi:hypothetical protein